MNTSNEAVNRLQQALDLTNSASSTIENLVAEHDYQDVATLVTHAASQLLEAALAFMNSQDETALDNLESAEELIDAIYDIIDAELGDE